MKCRQIKLTILLIITLFLAASIGLSSGFNISEHSVAQSDIGDLDSYEAIDGSMIVSRHENTIVRNLWISIDRSEHSGKLFLKMDDYEVNSERNKCLNKLNASDWNTHYVPEDCDAVSFGAKYHIGDTEVRSRDVSILRGRNFIIKDSFSLRVYERKEVFYEDINEGWRSPISAKKVLKTRTSENVKLNDNFILGGSRWVESEFSKKEDDVVFHYLEGENDASRFMSGLRNSTVISDGLNETVNVYVLPDRNIFSLSDVRNVPDATGVYYGSSNSFYLKPGAKFGAVVHEYGHSQQDYNNISRDLRWVFEASPTFESTLAITGTSAMNQKPSQRRGVVDEDVRESILSDRSTWASNTSYSKGQAVLFLIDNCVKERTDGQHGVSDIIEYNRRQVDNLTYDSFVDSIARRVVGGENTEYRRQQESKISTWLEEYVYSSRNPTESSVLGQNDSECWF